MAQHDYSIANQDGASFRGDLNAVLSAIATLNSGASEPTTMYADMLWFDTTTGLLKKRNSANTAWLTLADAMLAGQTIAGTLFYTNQLTRATEQATTSGTTKDFTSIPSWANKVTVLLNGVSLAAGDDLLLRIGSGSFATTGYVSSTSLVSSGASTGASTAGFLLTTTATASENYTGAITLAKITGNTWVAAGNLARQNNTGMCVSAGRIALGGTLDRVRLTSVAASAFDAGSVNIQYE